MVSLAQMPPERLNKMEISGDIMNAKIGEYEGYLKEEEKSRFTITKYLRDLRAFCTFLGNRNLTRGIVLEWKEYLTDHFAPASTNSMLAALNSFFHWMECPQLRVKPLKVQRTIFAKQEKELTKDEYIRLVLAAEKNQNQRLALILQTVCATGIRVSELSYITAESLFTGRASVDCKGKLRVVFLPKELCRKLKGYCRQQGIKKGIIFCSRNGKALDRSNIWREMKALCQDAQVEPQKVFPHNLRHLFARTYYTMEKDLSRLADLLGHSSVNTTRIYTMESGEEHVKQLERMQLVLTGL